MSSGMPLKYTRGVDPFFIEHAFIHRIRSRFGFCRSVHVEYFRRFHKDQIQPTMPTRIERRHKEAVEINMLDRKRSINVNIFLKQFRGGVEELANLIRCDRADEIGSPEKLRGMIKILPDQDEMEIIEGFTGDRTKLGDVEKFFLYLREI
ncbi:Inverted formin-2 [Trichinella nativa]|uniref:Inverted formin-2 n=1 Tax=Trichinella nativa TaxID=6335 RepID=A0A0V1KUB4_9BILA|nr:Inverted formin-2 [Trichinella nativa]